MSVATAIIAYDGPALRDGAMDVRDLAPALLAAGQLVDAANSALNGDAAQVSVKVTATGTGSFEVYLQVAQSITSQIVSLFSSPPATAATNLATWVFGTPATVGVIWLIKRLKGKSPDRIERLSESTVRIVIGEDSIEVPIQSLRLFQDIPVRVAAQKLIKDPLEKDGIDTFEVRERKIPFVQVVKGEADYFARPEIPDEVLVDDIRRSAYSIVALAFKEDNRWRLDDGVNVIRALIEDQDFLQRVNANQISFSKGDILICDVRVTQKQTDQGLRTEYVVVKVVEHRPGARQLPLPLPQ